MAWFLVPPLVELREAFNALAPLRDKASDGAIGDYAHSESRSSHNPDGTGIGNAEHEDYDGRQEVRAIDVDKDLGGSVTMEQCVQYLVKGCRSGRFWWIRYIIFNGRIWHANYDYATRTYTGVNDHSHHGHFNSDFTNAADTKTNCNYDLEGLDMPTAEEYADAVIARLDTAPLRGGRTLGGTLDALAFLVNQDPAKNPLMTLLLEDPYDTATPKRKVSVAAWLRYSTSKGQTDLLLTRLTALSEAFAAYITSEDADDQKVLARLEELRVALAQMPEAVEAELNDVDAAPSA